MHAARIAHHIPGRMRIVIAAGRRDAGFLARVAGEIEKLASVSRVEVSPASGSIIVRYERGQNDVPITVRALGAGLQLFELALEALDEPSVVRRRIDKRGSELGRELLAAAKLLNRELKLATGGTLDLRLLVPLSVAGLTALDARRAAGPTPLWMTLITFAFNSFVALHRGVPIEMAFAPRRTHD